MALSPEAVSEAYISTLEFSVLMILADTLYFDFDPAVPESSSSFMMETVRSLLLV